MMEEMSWSLTKTNLIEKDDVWTCNSVNNYTFLQPAGRTNRLTEGRRDAGRDRRTGGRTDGLTDERTDGRTNERTDARTDGWTDGRTDGRKDGRTGERSDWRTDGYMDGWTVSDRTKEYLTSQSGCVPLHNYRLESFSNAALKMSSSAAVTATRDRRPSPTKASNGREGAAGNYRVLRLNWFRRSKMGRVVMWLAVSNTYS